MTSNCVIVDVSQSPGAFRDIVLIELGKGCLLENCHPVPGVPFALVSLWTDLGQLKHIVLDCHLVSSLAFIWADHLSPHIPASSMAWLVVLQLKRLPVLDHACLAILAMSTPS